MLERKTSVGSVAIPWRLLGGLLLASIVLGGLYLLVAPNLPLLYGVIDSLTLLYSLMLALFCFYDSPRLLSRSRSSAVQGQSGRRFIPALLGMGLLCLVLGQAIRLYGTLRTQQEPIYPADFHFVYLVAYPFFTAAYLLLLSQNLSLLSRLRLLLDSLMIIVTIATLYCYFILLPVFALAGGTLPAKVVGNVFTTADLVLLCSLVFVALHSNEVVIKKVIVLLALTVLSAFVGHVAFLFGLLSHEHTVSIRANLSVVFGLALLPVVAHMIRHTVGNGGLGTPRSAVLLEETGISDRWRVVQVATLLVIFTGLVTALWTQQENEHFLARWLVVDIGGTLLLALLVLRQFLAMHEVNRLKGELREKNAQLDKLAASDPLTGVPNHRALVTRLDEALAHVKEQQTPCSILFMDIDHFKTINDQYGHAVGDLVLCQVTKTATSILRPGDCLGRWGGEEFVAVLPGQDLTAAFLLAERIRTRVSELVFEDQGDLHVTCSLGIATAPQMATEPQQLLNRADQAMYSAKQLGRNRTRAAYDPAITGDDAQT